MFPNGTIFAIIFFKCQTLLIKVKVWPKCVCLLFQNIQNFMSIKDTKKKFCSSSEKQIEKD